MVGELFSPILRRLLVDVMLAALVRDCGREQDDVAVTGEIVDEHVGVLGREMFRNLQALHQVEAPVEAQRCRKIVRDECVGGTASWFAST